MLHMSHCTPLQDQVTGVWQFPQGNTVELPSRYCSVSIGPGPGLLSTSMAIARRASSKKETDLKASRPFSFLLGNERLACPTDSAIWSFATPLLEWQMLAFLTYIHDKMDETNSRNITVVWPHILELTSDSPGKNWRILRGDNNVNKNVKQTY